MKKLILISIASLLFLCSCSWQGQKYPVALDTEGKMHYDEWWSMRFLWVSSGIETHTQTDHYITGSNIKSSMSDANSVESISRGVTSAIIKK